MPRKIQSNPVPMSRGFTLVELLVVMAIIALVISILLPALGGARNAAKTAATLSLNSDIVKAAESFQLDNRRMAGRFTAAEMGDSKNADRGLSGMENLLLDLTGGVVGEGTAQPAKFPKSIAICPKDYSNGKADPVWVDPGLIGAQTSSASKSYYLPQAKYFVAQPNNGLTGEYGQYSNPDGPSAKTETDPQLPDVVDAWGNPLLAWTEDESGGAVGSAVANFADISSDAKPAHFYWNQNAAFLKATALGRSRTNQTKASGSTKYSLIGSGVASTDIQNNMAVLLGNPNLTTDMSKDPVLPTAGRGRIVIQSAGLDGYFMGKRDKGARRIESSKDSLAFAMNFFKTEKAVKADRLKDRDGKEATFDVKDDFDDVVIAGGN